ncbi:outer membrane protein assembly factor BamD [Solimonas marina]|uniref:Outer membrane protein assembly factor BamD n=1 Tax=Solimonas marina TaxID=2714601 RepID=A0A969W8E5_9GAMM|nr:outer membrane protein assembly factor BamD [Solimonas marina]NKF21394.1 outer membrane protein assembly factor BamD [Solimonas marina]
MKLRILAATLLVVGLVACKSNPDKAPLRNPLKPDEVSQREQRLQAQALYVVARRSLDDSDFGVAIQRYKTLAQRFPFTEYSIQGQLEQVYAEYRSTKWDDALTDADHFLRDYPRHEHADYVQYLKGLINFDRDRGLEAMLGLDVSKRDISNLRTSFQDFQLLIQKYPKSVYVSDARLRMIDLRNRIADHDMTVVRFYMRRGAYIAAAKRAEQIVAEYPGSPITVEALGSLQRAYKAIGLNDQAADAAKLRQAYLDPSSVPKAANDAAPAPAPSAPVTSAPPPVDDDAPQGPTSQSLPPPAQHDDSSADADPNGKSAALGSNAL